MAGAKQVIILGSGFDTRALRLEFLRALTVIEIDHPDTASFKIARLKQELGSLPKNVTYLQTDFNRQSLEGFATDNHVNFSIPTAMVWEGVSNYISEEAIHNTF